MFLPLTKVILMQGVFISLSKSMSLGQEIGYRNFTIEGDITYRQRFSTDTLSVLGSPSLTPASRRRLHNNLLLTPTLNHIDPIVGALKSLEHPAAIAILINDKALDHRAQGTFVDVARRTPV